MLASYGHISLGREDTIMKIIRKYKKKEEEVMPVRVELDSKIMEQYMDIDITSNISIESKFESTKYAVGPSEYTYLSKFMWHLNHSALPTTIPPSRVVFVVGGSFLACRQDGFKHRPVDSFSARRDSRATQQFTGLLHQTPSSEDPQY